LPNEEIIESLAVVVFVNGYHPHTASLPGNLSHIGSIPAKIDASV
jgi:hypothetical protein